MYMFCISCSVFHSYSSWVVTFLTSVLHFCVYKTHARKLWGTDGRFVVFSPNTPAFRPPTKLAFKPTTHKPDIFFKIMEVGSLCCDHSQLPGCPQLCISLIWYWFSNSLLHTPDQYVISQLIYTLIYSKAYTLSPFLITGTQHNFFYQQYKCIIVSREWTLKEIVDQQNKLHHLMDIGTVLLLTCTTDRNSSETTC